MKKDKTLDVVVTFRIEKETIEKLKTYARKLSSKKDKDILYVDIIRDLIREKTEKL